MNRDDIIRMADEVGLRVAPVSGDTHPNNVYWHEVERFAELVAAAEREACARVCEAYDSPDPLNVSGECAERIRLRAKQ